MDNDKLFVVIAVLLVILAGIVIYLIWMDRRIKRLEREMQENKSGINEA
jgi:CcmD family protein